MLFLTGLTSQEGFGREGPADCGRFSRFDDIVLCSGEACGSLVFPTRTLSLTYQACSANFLHRATNDEQRLIVLRMSSTCSMQKFARDGPVGT